MGTLFVFWSDFEIPFYIENTFVQNVRLYYSKKDCSESTLAMPATPIYEESLVLETKGQDDQMNKIKKNHF